MSAASYPALGKKAPAFKAFALGGEYGEGREVTLASLKGKPVVLYFYPKDNTPGCTQQACAVRDGWQQIADRVHVFGVSIDSAKSHRKFIEKFELPFPLIVDEDKTLAEAYGVWVEKSMYGKTYFGTERTTFVIDEAGVLKAVLPKVKPKTHWDEVLSVLG